MKKIIRKILVGDNPIREYATVTITNAIQERVFLRISDKEIDVSQNQWVFCLEPVVFGLWIEDEICKIELDNKKKCTLIFKGSSTSKKKLAAAELTLVHKIEEPAGTLFLLNLKKCSIYHLNYFKAHLIFSRYYKKPTLSFKKLKSFVCAYSYPRKVRIISFRENDYYNIFPMDLIGEIKSEKKMVFGLRHTNRTLSKIIEAKKIIASEISYTQKEIIYKLGSHHSSAAPAIDKLPFKTFESEKFRFYIPDFAERYKEIEIVKTIDLGSHMLLWGKIINESILTPSSSSLYHIHFFHWLHQKKDNIEYHIV